VAFVFKGEVKACFQEQLKKQKVPFAGGKWQRLFAELQLRDGERSEHPPLLLRFCFGANRRRKQSISLRIQAFEFESLIGISN